MFKNLDKIVSLCKTVLELEVDNSSTGLNTARFVSGFLAFKFPARRRVLFLQRSMRDDDVSALFCVLTMSSKLALREFGDKYVVLMHIPA